MPSVGVVVFTLREMQQVQRCVESVEWADAVDLCALDSETGLCHSSWQREATDWVLYLWGEERVDPELARAVLSTVESAAERSVARYGVRVRSRLLDQWLEASCWGPVPSPRLLRGGLCALPCGWQPDGFDSRDLPVLPGWISDHSLEELGRGVDQLNALSTIWALSFNDVPQTPLKLAHLPFRVLSALLFRNGLWRHGLPGLALSIIAGYGCLATLMKAWEVRCARAGAPPIEPL